MNHIPQRDETRRSSLTPPKKHPGGDSRTVLLDAALWCFAHRGFDGTSIRDISEKAKRNSSLISYHFGCKEGLYEEVFHYVLEARRPNFQPIPGSPGSIPMTADEAMNVLRDLISMLCSDFVAGPDQADQGALLRRMLFLNELREPRPAVVALLREFVAPWLRRFGDCLCVLRPELTEIQRKFLGISIMGEMMVHLMMQGLRPWEWEPESFDAGQAVDLLTDFNLRALRGFGS